MGTRPEIVKFRPVIRALKKYLGEFYFTLINTGQHTDLIASLGIQNIPVDQRFAYKFERETLSKAALREVYQLDKMINLVHPHLLVVQGDTTSAFAAALAAYYARVPIAHIEAGLRTGDVWDPYPEEGNRRFIATIASLHFAPTPFAKESLLLEGAPRNRVFVTGNTGIDALMEVLHKKNIDPNDADLLALRKNSKLVLVTAHRRENQPKLANIMAAIKMIAKQFPDHVIVFPVHPSPVVKSQARKHLGNLDNVRLVEPMAYETFVDRMLKAKLILTDSGGVQEESAHLGVPTLNLREKTERPESVTAGVAALVGSKTDAIFSAAARILSEAKAWEEMARPSLLYGDGYAAERIVTAIRGFFDLTSERPTIFIPHWHQRILGPREKLIRPSMFTVEEAIEHAANWLLASGIQNLSGDPDKKGGVYAWYDEKNETYPYLYSEITGYFISACLYLHARRGDATSLERARLAAKWLTEQALDTQASLMRTRYYLDEEKSEFASAYSFKGGVTYSFDNGIIMNSLMNLYKATGDEAYFKVACAIARSLIEKFQMNDGLFHATYGIQEGKPMDDMSVWSRHPGSHHAKLALGLLDIYDKTGEEEFMNSALRMCRTALNYQHDNGRFAVFRQERDTFTHYHLYSAEGLLYVATRSSKPPDSPVQSSNFIFAEKAYRAFNWLLRTMFIAHTGGISKSYINHSPVALETSDIIAQTIRLGALFKSAGLLNEAQEQKIRFIVERLLAFQCRSSNTAAFGGFYYGQGSTGDVIPHVNSWATIFALQALDMYNRAFNLGEPVDMSNFA
ncbi:MAG: UDP-N-acetylglucosamine 2-epimerase (non-hydrolyzing) [Candidatus Margulisbacteria bacterium]|nr:UDP-N-acetylglucosamine 2-epimerase (non-hydrolyzing) [Candidatus Margulisiibacteriota bacterium]